jgi:lysophospholipase L1-like esterase
MKHTALLALLVVLALVAVFVIGEYLYIIKTGRSVPAPTIPRQIQSFGTHGPRLRYVVMGDSTSIGQGARYEQAYSYASAQHLAQKYQVQLLNVGISGAVAKSVLADQLAKAVAAQPDIVLLAVGANDATHFTSGSSFEKSTQAIIDSLRTANPSVTIVVTGCPAMGSVARFPFGARQLAGLRERQINRVYARLVAKNNLIFAPVAKETGPAFAADATLFAQDKFHPNARGYALWIPVVNKALDRAL